MTKKGWHPTGCCDDSSIMTATALGNTTEVLPEGAPYRDRLVLVECDGVRRLAKQDQSGKWRTLSRHKELQGQIEIVRVVR
jgi:hypothetical protein